MVALARQGKRSIVALNKKDRLIDADREAILAKLRERLTGLVAPADVVAVSASPRPMPGPDPGRSTARSRPPSWRPSRPTSSRSASRIAAVLDREGEPSAPGTSCSGPT